MTADSRRASSDLDRDGADILSALADVSLRLALAKSEGEFRAVLESAVPALVHAAAGPVAIGELGLLASGKTRFLWCSRSGGLVVDDGDLFENWYARASLRDSALLPAQPASWQGLLSDSSLSGDTGLRVAVFFHGGNLPPECIVQGRAIANAAAVAIVRIRSAMAALLDRRRVEGLFSTTQSWLELDADILWEAGEDGVVRVHRTMNGRSDMASLVDGIGIALVRAADNGRSLQDILRERRSVRRLRVELDGGPPGGFYVSATTSDDDSGSLRF